MDSTIKTTAFKVVNDGRQGFGANMEIGQAVQGYLASRHGNEIFDDLLGNGKAGCPTGGHSKKVLA
jgi:hypothetical protein